MYMLQDQDKLANSIIDKELFISVVTERVVNTATGEWPSKEIRNKVKGYVEAGVRAGIAFGERR